MKLLWSLVVVALTACLPAAQSQCLNGDCFNGQGSFLYPSGARYVGQFRNGKIHGEGILYFSNGNKYVGQWSNHYRDGKGKMVFNTGDIYQGNFKRSKFHGYGEMTFTDGERYEGQWRNDLQNGQGVYYYKDGDRYEGNFSSGKLNGKGTMFYANGARYAGNWKDNYKDGQGAFYKTNGSKVSGFWLAGKYVGNSSKEESTSETAGTEVVLADGLRDCNQMHCGNGMGTYTYSDGSRWVGEFIDGMPEGQGTCYYANGDRYVGGWRAHAPHNEGVMHYTSGRVFGAIWDHGQPVGDLKSKDEQVPTEEVAVYRSNEVKIWAVVVGVARYAHMPVLKYTDDDAYHIYAFLKSPEGGALQDEQLRVLVDEDATRTNIMRAMQQVFMKADENDVVLLYFSGHGLPGSFLPVDFDGFNNKLHHEDIQELFRETKAKHKICLADACHSGTLTAMRSPFDNTLRKYYEAFERSSGGTALLLSSKGDEFSLEDQGLRQGIFSHFLIRGLKGEADKDLDKIVTIKELFDFVHTKVTSYTANAQTPSLTGQYDDNMPVSNIR